MEYTIVINVLLLIDVDRKRRRSSEHERKRRGWNGRDRRRPSGTNRSVRNGKRLPARTHLMLEQDSV